MKNPRRMLLTVSVFGVLPAAVALTTQAWMGHLLRQWADLEHDPKRDFYAAGNLTQRVTPSEAEDRERYEDPLGAVPPLPFGYLNGIWKDFLDQRPRKAELWAFDSLSRKEEDTGWFKRHAKARGYAWVVRGEIKQEIVVEG